MESLRQQIPKRIMQTWKTTTIPDKWKSSQEAVLRLMPDYQYTLLTDFDNERLVREHFPNFLDKWNNFRYPIQKADAIRYMWLYLHGGFYLDLDLEPQDRFDFLLNQGELLLLPSANNISCLTNSFMASVPRHPFWLEVLEAIGQDRPIWAQGKFFEVMYTTGPNMLNKVAKESRHNFTSLSPRLIGSPSVCTYQVTITGSLFKALEGGSWLPDWFIPLMQFFRCSKPYVLKLGLIILLLFVLILLLI